MTSLPADIAPQLALLTLQSWQSDCCMTRQRVQLLHQLLHLAVLAQRKLLLPVLEPGLLQLGLAQARN